MALVLIYIFPLIVALVFLPKPCESSIQNNGDKSVKAADIRTYNFEEEWKENQVKRHDSQVDNPADGDTGTKFVEPTDLNPEEILETDGDDDQKEEEDFKNKPENPQEAIKIPLETIPDSSPRELLTSLLPTPAPTTCSKCNNDPEVEKQVRIEMVKQYLLKKLELEAPPNVDGPLPPLPFDFYVGENFNANDEPENDNDEEEISSVKTRQIFIFGKDITDTCWSKKSTGCYSFDTASSGIDPDLVSSIELWIYKQPDVNDHHLQEFMVSELEPFVNNGKNQLRFRNIVKRIETRLKYGWMKIYVKRSVLRWLSKPHRNHGLAVVCKTCQRQNHKTIYGNKEGYMPILVFYMKQNRGHRRRPRREARCQEGVSNCCHREGLQIKFSDIGWDYIMAPEIIRPNYCTGSCIGAAYHNHTRLVQSLQQTVAHRIDSIETCCSPVSFGRPQSLLYLDNTGTVRKVDVPNIIVSECGCT